MSTLAARNAQRPWALGGATFVVWLLAAASLAYWGLKLFGSAPPAPPTVAAPRVAAPADAQAVARLLGSAPSAPSMAPAPPSLASRLSLVGVVADRARSGVALIAVDGKPARPFQVGRTIEPGLVVQSVQGRRAVLAASVDSPALLTLELPPVRP